MVYAVTKRDPDAIVDGYFRLGMADPDINRATLRDAAEMLMNIQLNQEVTPKQVQEIAQQIVETFHRFPLRLPNQFVYLLRAATLIEGIALYYNPRFNSLKDAEGIVRRMLLEIAFNGEKPLRQRAADLLKEAFLTVRETATIIHRLERERLQVRIHEADFFAAERFFRRFLRRLMLGLAVLFAGFAGCLASWLHHAPILLICWAVFSTLLLLVLALWPINRGGTGPYFR